MSRSCSALVFGLAPTLLAAGCHAEPASVGGDQAPDPLLWLEDRYGARALEWVQAQNERTLKMLGGDSRFEKYRDSVVHDQIGRQSDVAITVAHGWAHRVVQDAAHPRGIWQRVRYAALTRAKGATPEGARKTEWETVLDLDALAADERKEWFFSIGAWSIQCLPGDAASCMVSLSEKGSDDTATLREFSLKSRRFPADGFVVPPSQSLVQWTDPDTLVIAPDDGPQSRTIGGGHPFTVRLWRRGVALASAPEIWRGSRNDTGGVRLLRLVDESGKAHLVIRQQHARWSRTHWLLDASMRPQKIQLPHDASVYAAHRGQLVFAIDEGWHADGRSYGGGSLLSASLTEVAREKFAVHVLSERAQRESDYYPVMASSAGVLTTAYANMRPRVLGFSFDEGKWRKRTLITSEEDALRPELVDADSPIALVAREGFVRPAELFRVDVASGSIASFEKPQHAPDASRYVVERAEAASADGVLIPYSIARLREVAYDGTAPTLLYAYGGSQGSRWPTFSSEREKLWLRKGGVYVVANIRGGAEFGPAWHSAAVKTHKQVSVDDVIAVAEALIRRRVTTPQRLGIEGESNGGMVMGAVLVQRPELLGAAILEVPDLDLLRYTVLNGYEHTEEIGSPDVPIERAALQKLSPYANLRRRPDFPVPLLISSTVDEVVHPAHARKFTAKMQSLGMQALYYESATGGHHHNFTPREWADYQARKYVYLARRLMDQSAR